MRKITLFFTTCLMAILLMGGFLQAQTVYPYFSESSMTDLSGTATIVSDPSSHAIAFQEILLLR